MTTRPDPSMDPTADRAAAAIGGPGAGADPTPDELRALSSQLLIDFLPMATFAKEPFVLVEGDGIRVRDSNGRWYIDGMSGVFVSAFGHGNRRLVEAARAQASKLAFHAPLYSANIPSLQLMDRLLEITPGGYTVGKLTASGSEATEAAIKMARQYQHQSGRGRRFKVFSHYRSYHGSTGHALAASGGVGWRSEFEPYAPGFVHVHAPFAVAGRLRGAVGAPDGQAAEDAALALIEETIELEDPDTIAAFITEPIMLSAGVRVPPPGYLRRLHEILRHHEILLIHDEIITGMGRTGRLFASEWFDVAPDILCFGKGISGGYAPLAGMLVQPRVAERFWGEAGEGLEFRDGHTYGNNPLAAAVGLAALDQLQGEALVANAERQGDRLAARLRAAALPAIAEIRGRGLLVGVAFASALGPAVARAARERGLIVRQGPDFVALGPPLVVTHAEIDEIADITLASVTAAAAAVASR
jgi:beta-alanine--pyruvate transaminase